MDELIISRCHSNANQIPVPAELFQDESNLITGARTIICMRSFGLAALLSLSFVHQVPAQTRAVETLPNLYTASFHTFSVLRSGIEIDDPATGVHHPASHTQDATLAGTRDRRDLAGGWYNAGDYGKWPMMAAITVSYLLDLYELQQSTARSRTEFGHQPDPLLLEEARWGLT